MHRIRQGYLSSKGNNDEHRRLVEAADVLGKAPIFLDDSPGLDITELRARARRMKQKHGVRLIIVDYLQLLHSREHARQGRQFEIAEVSGNIKGMAKELGLPVMVLSQLSLLFLEEQTQRLRGEKGVVEPIPGPLGHRSPTGPRDR